MERIQVGVVVVLVWSRQFSVPLLHWAFWTPRYLRSETKTKYTPLRTLKKNDKNAQKLCVCVCVCEVSGLNST